MVAKQDYAAAAALKQQIDACVQGAAQFKSATAPVVHGMRDAPKGVGKVAPRSAVEDRSRQRQQEINDLVSKQDYHGAAALKEIMAQEMGTLDVGDSPSTPFRMSSQSTRAVRVSLPDLFQPAGLLHAVVQLEGVRLLSIGKISAGKGKCKRPRQRVRGTRDC